MLQLAKNILLISQLTTGIIQFALHHLLLLVESLALALQTKDALFKLRSFQQIGVAAGDGHVLSEWHSVLFILTALVELSLAQGACLHLTDEVALGLQEIEIVAVKTALDGIDQDIHLVVSKVACNKVSLTDGTTITLLHVAGSPRQIQMMNGHGSPLGIHTCS